MTALISAEHVSLIRGGRRVLDDVSIGIKENDFVTIVGPNGAGKTMLLHVLMGFCSPDVGHVRRRKNLRLAYMPQSMPIDYTMPITVKRFLTLGKSGKLQASAQLLEELGLEQKADVFLRLLSGGEFQRALLARALINMPELLVLDEPAQNLDINGQLAFYSLLEQVHRRHHLSIVMVSHDLHLVMASTRHVVCLFHHVCCRGEPQSVARTSEFARIFGPEAVRMMAFYHHHHKNQREGEGAHG